MGASKARDLLYACAADALILILGNVLGASAKMTYGGVFSQNDGLVFNVDLDGVVFCDAKSLADLLGYNDTAKLVDVSDNAC